MPIASIGGILCDVLFNSKYAGCVYKVTVAIDSLGNIVWICPLAPGTSADVLIWDREGPKRVKGHYMDYEIGMAIYWSKDVVQLCHVVHTTCVFSMCT